MHSNRVVLQIRPGLHTDLRTRTSDLATRRDQPCHTSARVQNRGRTAPSSSASTLPRARDQDRRVPSREARALPRGKAIPSASRKESASARGPTIPSASVQDQAHLPRTQVDQAVQRMVIDQR